MEDNLQKEQQNDGELEASVVAKKQSGSQEQSNHKKRNLVVWVGIPLIINCILLWFYYMIVGSLLFTPFATPSDGESQSFGIFFMFLLTLPFVLANILWYVYLRSHYTGIIKYIGLVILAAWIVLLLPFIYGIARVLLYQLR